MAGTDDGDHDADRDVAAVARELEAARRAKAEAEAAVEERGEETVVAIHDAVEKADRLLERYVDSATGTGDFESYLEFQGAFHELVEEVPEDTDAREAFEAADDVVDQRRLSESDFERAREALGPAREVAALLTDREEARERFREAEKTATRRLAAVEDRIADHERLLELGQADLDAPTEELREPVDAYDESVREAFTEFKREAAARDVLAFVEKTTAYPLVDFETPPPDLAEYVREQPAGEESIPTLLEYADYSRSKVDHYVEDPAALQTTVAVHRTYLTRLDADPLVVGWPPPEREALRFLAEELVSVVARFAGEGTVALAREVRRAAEHDDYERLRTAAVARSELTEAERERLRSGAVESSLADLREARDRLAEALSD